MFIATSLNHYKRKAVRKAIASQAEFKEISVMYGRSSFGKRPDTIEYPDDVLEFAKRKVSSFHCSEELWFNPLAIQTGMKRSELDELRKGWDFILDIDCPDWHFSRLISHLFVRVLQEFGVHSVTAKFSGNKGFHIAVPFEAFPEKIWFEDKYHETKDLFPDGPRKIASYLLGYITEHFADIGADGVTFDSKYFFSFEQLEAIARKSSRSLFAYQCSECGAVVENEPVSKTVYQCSECGTKMQVSGHPDVVRCTSCSAPVTPTTYLARCSSCAKQSSFSRILNLLSIVEVDTILIASRHLYRMPYSLHEKSGLVSIPVSINSILSFEKNQAKPPITSFEVPFLDRSKVNLGEASNLISEAFGKELRELGHIHADINTKGFFPKKDFDLPSSAIEEEFFPPCIKHILSGLEDGRKRALFILINFLESVGWSHEQITHKVYAWNESNPEPLREQYLKGQLSSMKKNKKVLPPPNCSNKDYYVGLGICTPNEFCNRIKNPSSYARKKKDSHSKTTSRRSKKSSAKKTTKKSTKKSAKKASKTSSSNNSSSNSDRSVNSSY
ncbi:MAG: DNA primase small subunit domain-containing protein [Nanobdellota archaeon]